jgi:hypothetical protein
LSHSGIPLGSKPRRQNHQLFQIHLCRLNRKIKLRNLDDGGELAKKVFTKSLFIHSLQPHAKPIDTLSYCSLTYSFKHMINDEEVLGWPKIAHKCIQLFEQNHH